MATGCLVAFVSIIKNPAGDRARLPLCRSANAHLAPVAPILPRFLGDVVRYPLQSENLWLPIMHRERSSGAMAPSLYVLLNGRCGHFRICK